MDSIVSFLISKTPEVTTNLTTISQGTKQLIQLQMQGITTVSMSSQTLFR